MLGASFTGPANSNPVAHFLSVRNATRVTVGDCLWGGQYLRTRIRQRTASGVDVNGESFAPYSEGYAVRKTKELGHSNVDLFGFDRGTHMLNAMLVKAGGQELSDYSGSAGSNTEPVELFTLGIYDEDLAKRARVHNEGAQMRTRLGLASTSMGGQYPLLTSGKAKGVTVSRASKKTRAAYATMPKREFFGANNEDIAGMESGMGARQLTRLQSLAS